MKCKPGRHVAAFILLFLAEKPSYGFELLRDFETNLPINIIDSAAIYRALKKMEEGIFKLELQHRGLENLINALDKATNRLSYSLILVAIIIGSSLIMQTEKGPQFMGFPVIGVIGFLISGILGLGLVIMILRSGKM